MATLYDGQIGSVVLPVTRAAAVVEVVVADMVVATVVTFGAQYLEKWPFP